MAIIIGLTGGIATGKSTVSKLFVEHMIPVIDADVIARAVCHIGEPAYLKIVETFGQEILLDSGELNRKKLGDIVFNDPESLTILNNIIHPEVKEAIKEAIIILKNNNYIVLDVPLLFESGFNDLCDLTLVIYTDEITQLNRLMKRDNITKEEALTRINAQMDIDKKVSLADVVIDNSASICETRKLFYEFLQKLKCNKGI